MIAWLERLVDHLAWADERTLGVVRRAGDDRARELLAHVLATERVWLARIRTGDSSHLEIWPDLDLRTCGAWLSENVEAYRGLLDEIDPDGLADPVPYRNSSGEEFRTPLVEILTHVALHGSHHRGQIARRVGAAGGEPADVDFIQFVRAHPGAPSVPGDR